LIASQLRLRAAAQVVGHVQGVKPKTRKDSGTLLLAVALAGALSTFLAGCTTGPARTTASGSPEDADARQLARSSAWSGVLPTDSVNNQPLAMAEYNNEYARNDAGYGVMQGPPGEVLGYYATPSRPSLEWQYRFTLNTSPDSVVVFRRGDYSYRRYEVTESYQRRAYESARRGW